MKRTRKILKTTKRRKPTAKKKTPTKTVRPASSDQALGEQLADLLDKGSAHASWRDILSGIPEAMRGTKPPRAPHTAWQLLEHLRIAQWDILEFSRNPKHVSPEFPQGYWPATEMPPSVTAWETSVKAFERDLTEMRELVSNPRTDLFGRIPHGDGQTVLREAVVLASHNAYHLGQIVLLRRMQGAWTAAY